MEQGNHESSSSSSNTLDPDLYPDLVRWGGLVSAIVAVAQENSLVIGSVYSQYQSGPGLLNSANIDSGRGKVIVSIGRDDRHFSMNINENRFVWASGTTKNLLDVVGVASAWLSGAKLRELGERFPCISYSRLARAYEDGDPVATQWDELLNHEEYESDHALILAAYNASKLRVLFPYLSHKMLRLSLDFRAKGAKEVRIYEASDGVFMVEHTANESMQRRFGSIEKAIEYASSLV